MRDAVHRGKGKQVDKRSRDRKRLGTQSAGIGHNVPLEGTWQARLRPFARSLPNLRSSERTFVDISCHDPSARPSGSRLEDSRSDSFLQGMGIP